MNSCRASNQVNNSASQRRTVPRVLMVAPGRHVHGGISAVIARYEQRPFWREFSCRWLETYDDRSAPWKIMAFARAVANLPIALRSADIVHIHGSRITSLRRKSFFLAVAMTFRKRIVFHFHGGYADEYATERMRAKSRWIMRHSDAVIALARPWAHLLRDICPDADIRVIPNAVEIPKWQTKWRADVEPVILFMGQIIRLKGYNELIRAMPLVLAQVPNARLIIAGDGEMAAAERLAHELGIADRVEFPGWVMGSEKEALFARAAAFCLPSYGEGLPGAMLEAMARRIPVVVTPVGGIPDVVMDRQTGLLVPVGNPHELARALLCVLTDTNLACRLRQQGFTKVANDFSPEHVERQLRDLYLELWNRRLRGPNRIATQ